MNGKSPWISIFRLKSKWSLGEQSGRAWGGRREIMGLGWVLSEIGAEGNGEVGGLLMRAGWGFRDERRSIGKKGDGKIIDSKIIESRSRE